MRSETNSSLNDPLISVIVPVYNQEQYIKRCVDSLLNQTYQNLELILVDDGSFDSSPGICDRYALQDSRVHTVHKRNGGASSARNAGIDVAKGEVLTFVDADDWVARDTYRYAISLIKQYEADGIEYGITWVSEEREENSPRECLECLEGKEILQHYMLTTTTTGSSSMCRCVFKAATIGTKRFVEGRKAEDIEYKYRVLRDCKRFVISNQIKYYYYQHGDSASTGGLVNADFDLYWAAETLEEMTRLESYGDIAFLGRVKLARTPFSLLSKIAFFGIKDTSIDKTEVTKRLIKEHRRNILLLLKAPLPASRKILSVLFFLNFDLTAALVRLYKLVGGKSA